MSKTLTTEEMEALGVSISGKVMENGEKRFFMRIGDAAYIWTEPPTDQAPSWQNAHYHKGVRETYIVERGRMAFAEQSDDGVQKSVRIYGPGEVVTSQPAFCHNVYLFASSAIHTVKHGEPVGNPNKKNNDWWPANPLFDEWTKGLTEADIGRLHLATAS